MSKYLNMHNDKDFPILAKTLGSLEKAYVLAKIDAWVIHNEENHVKGSYADGRYWMFSTISQLYENMFCFYGCEKTLQRHLKDLERSGFLIRERHNKIKSQRLWYRVDRAKVHNACEITKMEMKGIITKKVDENGVISWENRQAQ